MCMGSSGSHEQYHVKFQNNKLSEPVTSVISTWQSGNPVASVDKKQVYLDVLDTNL